MGRDPFAPDPPALQDVLDALDDPACQAVLEQLDRPRSARQLADLCDVPESTMYRKLALLSDASLVEEQTQVRADGRHTTQYVRNFDAVRISLDDEGQIEVAIKRRSRTPDERLSDLWSEVRKET